jgi:hypothetical protein
MAEARILYIATDDGLIQLANPGRSDRWREVGRALEHQPVRVVVAAPNDPLLIVAATAEAVHRTTDGGFSWEPIWQGEATALAFADDDTLYVGTRQGVLLRQDGEQWAEVLRADQIISGLSAGAGHASSEQFTDLALKRIVVVAERVVCCTAEHVLTLDLVNGFGNARYAPGWSQLTVITDATARQALVLGMSSTSSEGYTGAAVLLGGNEPVLLVGTNEALLRSTDGAPVVPEDSADLTYADVNLGQLAMAEVPGPLNVSALVTPPRFIDQVFGTTRSGELWFSSDRGRTWAALRTDLPPANDLAFARAR